MARRGMAALAPLALGACLAQPPPAVDPAGAPDAAAALVDAAPDAALAGDQLLDNTGFEDGAESWIIDGSAMIGNAEELGVSFSAASGEHFAQVGRRNDAVNGIVQQVTVPAWASSLRLTGLRCFTTEDLDPSADDVLTIVLRDVGGEVLEALLMVSNAEVGSVCDWSSFELPAAESHAGELIELALVADSDVTSLTAFWFDDLELVAQP